MRSKLLFTALALASPVCLTGCQTMVRGWVYPGLHRMDGASLRAVPMPDGGKELWIEHDQGRTEAWWLPPTVASQEIQTNQTSQPDEASETANASHRFGDLTTVVFSHGNGEWIQASLNHVKPFRDLGLAVLLVEFRGYGDSDGKPSEQALSSDVLAAMQLVSDEQNVPLSSMVLWGHSMGGGVVAQALVRLQEAGVPESQWPQALLLESTYSNLKAVVRHHHLPAPGWLLKDTYDTEAVLAEYPGHVMVMHGLDDHVIPVEHAWVNVQAAEEHAASVALWLHPRGHVSLVNEQSWQAVETWLEAISQKP